MNKNNLQTVSSFISSCFHASHIHMLTNPTIYSSSAFNPDSNPLNVVKKSGSEWLSTGKRVHLHSPNFNSSTTLKRQPYPSNQWQPQILLPSFWTQSVILLANQGKFCPECLKNLETSRVTGFTICRQAYCECIRIRKWTNLKRQYPLCTAHFESWFCKIHLPSQTFYE